MSSVHFIVNPYSAAGKTGRDWAHTEPMIRANYPDAQFHFTQKSGHASELARHAALNGATLVVACGGDGTNNEVVNGLLQDGRALNPETRFATLPMGTGGDLIRTLGIARNTLEALKQLQTARTQQLDVGRLRFTGHNGQPREHYFINIAAFGLAGLTDQLVGAYKKWGGSVGFALGALHALARYKAQSLRLEDENGQLLFEGPIMNAAVCNGCYFGGGMQISPQSNMSDGAFDLIVIERMSVPLLLAKFASVYAGTHLSDPSVKSFKIKSLRAIPQAGAELLMDVDGEPLGRLPLELQILPAALPALVI